MEVKKVEGTIHELGTEVNKKVRLLESMMFPHSLSINHVHTYAYTHTHTNCHIQTHTHTHQKEEARREYAGVRHKTEERIDQAVR